MINLIGNIEESLAIKFANDMDAVAGQKEIEINLSTYGGCINAMFSIESTIKQHQANGSKIIIHCAGAIMSAGVYIALCADEITNNNSFWMAHKCRGGVYGTAEHIKNSMQYDDWIDNKIKSKVENILTLDQLNQFENDKDVYFEPNVKKINKYLGE